MQLIVDLCSAFHGNDIALIRLSSSLTFSSNLRPICIPPSDIQVSPETEAIATGWGGMCELNKNVSSSRTAQCTLPAISSPDWFGPQPQTLYQVRLSLISNTVCGQRYKKDTIFPSQVCAGDPLRGGVGACQVNKKKYLKVATDMKKDWH